MLTTSTDWTNSVAASSVKIIPLIRLYYGPESSYIAVSTYDITHDSVFYRGLLKSNITSSEGIDVHSHNHTISNLVLNFINYNYKQNVKFSDYIEDTSLGSGADIGFYNRKCDIRLATQDVTTWSNSFPFFVGIVREIQHDIDSVKFTVEDRNSLKYTTVPSERITASDYPLAPNNSKGIPVNIVVGDHGFTNLDATTPSISLSNDSVMVKGLDSQANRNQYIFANDTSSALTTDDIWLYDKTTDRFLKLDTSHVTISNPDGNGYTSVVLRFSSNNMIVYDWWLSNGGSNPSADYDFTDPGNAGDGDLSTKAVLNQTFSSGSGTKTAILRVLFPDYDMSGYEYIDDIEIFYKGNYTAISGDDSDITAYVGGSGIDVSSTLNVKSITSEGAIHDIGSSDLAPTKNTIEYSGGDGSDTFKLSFDGTATANILESANAASLSSAITALSDFDSLSITKSSNQWFVEYKGVSLGKYIPKPDVLDRTDDLSLSITETQNGKTATAEMVGSAASGYLDLTVRQPTSAKTPLVNLQVHELYKKVKLVFGSTSLIDRNRFEVYARMSGREYGTWVNGRSTAEGFSVNHPKDDGSGDLIENPSGVIESVYRDDLGFVDADIVEDDFNVTADFLSSWKHSFTIPKETDTKDLITSLCRESRSFSFIRADNTIRHKVIKDTYSSSDATIYKDDILDIGYSRTPIKDIRTKVLVHYANDYSGNSRKETSASQETDAQSKYNVTAADSLLEYKSSHIADSDTAGYLRDYLLKQWQQPHNILDITLPLKYMYLEIGDVIDLSISDIWDTTWTVWESTTSDWDGTVDTFFKIFGEDILTNSTRMSQTIYKYWFVISTKKSTDNIKIKAFQLHDLS